MMFLAATVAQAQITIGGSVYGGGNAGNTGGQTKVTVHAGDINEVFGGARMANVEGSAFVHIDGEHASNYIIINKLFGGNDIAGTIGTSTTLPTKIVSSVPINLLTKTEENHIDNTWNAFVRISTKMTTNAQNQLVPDETQKTYIGQLFGGGNGEYYYKDVDNKHNIYKSEKDYKDGKDPIASNTTGFTQPSIGKTYLEVLGGSIVYAYGGGNNATVTDRTVICVDNPSKVVNSIIDATNPNAGTGGELLTTERFIDKMGINTGLSYPSSDAFQIGRLFGGNNKAEMAIRPTWNLKSGLIRNLYSGGNLGAMTNKEGLLLEILADSKIVVDNVYGGCRMADVHPLKSGTLASGVYEESGTEDIHLDNSSYNFPKGLPARVVISGGDINNVYGGNDVTGKVYGGNAIGIRTSIRGDVYGGGNGSYPYTDKKDYINDDVYGDLYYPIPTGKTSVEALNDFRPNAEAVSIRLFGTEAKPTIIGGSVYCGGNSATLRNDDPKKDAAAELKIGSYVYADKVFLGNNGENMVTYNAEEVDSETGALKKREGTLRTMKTVNSMNLANKDVFAQYMDGVAMRVKPRVIFDTKGDTGYDYIPYTTYFGSFYCGGNVGSMRFSNAVKLDFSNKIVIFDKLVGGCNDAYIEEHYTEDATPVKLNAAYEGGVLEDPDSETGNKIIMDLSGVKIQPMRWKDTNDKTQGLEWNIIKWDDTQKKYVNAASKGPDDNLPDAQIIDGKTYHYAGKDDLARRFTGGNIYGGCYNSGIVNGNVVINIDSVLMERDKLFDEVESDALGEESVYYDKDYDSPRYNIKEYRTGVILGQQGMDVLGKSLNVFGGGYGKNSEIWGSTTINMNAGYVFQVFGGSEQGIIGKPVTTGGTYTFNEKSFKYDPQYSCYINLKGKFPGVSKSNDKTNLMMAECEFMYGGGFLGPICGNTVINLGKGRIFNSFAGSCNADILGHTETYIGRMIQDEYSQKMGYLGKTKDTDNTTYLIDKEDYYVEGFPWVRDITYGGNDLGGKILNSKDFTARVNANALSMVYGYDANSTSNPDVLTASAYTEYLQGRTDAIFGGCFGTYDYTDSRFGEYFNADGSAKTDLGYSKPRMDNAFVNFRPTTANADNMVNKIYGAGQGKSGDRDSDKMQDRSYVLIDAPQDWDKYVDMEVFGAGAWGGLGMNTKVDPDAETPPTQTQLDGVSAIIDLVRGKIGSAYGGSLNEGFTRRTLVNVPKGSTIKLGYLTDHVDDDGNPYTKTHYGNIFGGAYGENNDAICDVYEANVEFHSAAASVAGAIYGGNNSYRRTLYGKVNVDVAVTNKDNGYGTTIYGAGYGVNTWSEYTEVNLLKGASVWEVYGGGQEGKVTNLQTAEYLANGTNSLAIPTGYVDKGLNSALTTARHDGQKYNTNVLIHKGAVVNNYAYGGGKGVASIPESGNVNGTTYIALLGGVVKKDLYAAGKAGNVINLYESLKNDFTASSNAYIAGGTLRNVYGGGYMGSVGKHGGTAEIDYKDLLAFTPTTEEPDIPGETHVTIGIRDDQSNEDKLTAMKKVDANAVLADYGINNGVPAVQRNAYGGGEGEFEKGGRGGAVWGTANLTLNNGYIGYAYLNGKYEEKLNDETWTEGSSDNWTPTDSIGRLRDCGNVFGGGYSDKSNVDFTDVTIWGGIIRNSLHGGAEVAAIGRGATKEEGAKRTLLAIYKPGGTRVTMYNGKVKRNVFGGGKGYNILGYGGVNDLYTDGYVFGSTKVFIHGGEIGTKEGVVVQQDGSGGYGNVFGGGDIGYVYSKGTKSNEETGSPNHYYYFDSNNELTEDCQVVISPYLQVKKEIIESADSISYDNKKYGAYDYVPTDYLNTLPKKKADGTYTGTDWEKLYTGENAGKDNNTSLDDNVDRGVIIHNAVFAGGNVSSNSDKTYANATTVYGNTTATINDVYHRDFISVGTEHIGGIYGGGNLSVVDGYRELNITNYGTDYYGLDQQITYEAYQKLTNRERAYFELEYVYTGTTEVTIKGTKYKNGDHVKESVFKTFEGESGYVPSQWEKWGFCSIYAGRLMNTIQRADFCGVFGSRMVLQGAKDRVAEVGDATEYTINRIGELSLNKQRSVIDDDKVLKPGAATDSEDYLYPEDALHGNYFGIYSVVNYLGNLTSDVYFDDPRRYVLNGDTLVDTKTYYGYKTSNQEGKNKRNCNNGISYNQVALASGVFLEMTTEHSTTTKKVYGDITGVVELDLINVKKDIVGGGYVYARNEHGPRSIVDSYEHLLLSPYNQIPGNEARTKKMYTYDDDVDKRESWQTSGNFIHKKKRIVDDCYPNNNEYSDANYEISPAHYWYIKGDVYVYEQTVSAYTGAASAYSKEVKIPLTITAGANGRLQLLNVQPNLYAYYKLDDGGNRVAMDENGVKVDNESTTYHLNDVITWWDWHQLVDTEQQCFVSETMVNVDSCFVGASVNDTVKYAPGTYVKEHVNKTSSDYTDFKAKVTSGDLVVFDNRRNPIDADHLDGLFRSSNNISHETGYVLTFDMDTPKDWSDWYSPKTGPSTYTDDGTNREKKDAYDALSAADKANYREGPTFRLKSTSDAGLYGQRTYSVGDLLSGEVVGDYTTTLVGKTLSEELQNKQAEVDKAYVAKVQTTYTNADGNSVTVIAGNGISKYDYENRLSTTQQANFAEAYLCTSTIQLGKEEFILQGDLVDKSDFNTIAAKYREYNNSLSNIADITPEEAELYVHSHLSDAYCCTKDGLYGGQWFNENENYGAIKAWCSLTDQRDMFEFNYDAFDVLSDSQFTGVHNDYPTTTKVATSYKSPYSDEKSVEYDAKYTGTSDLTYSIGTTSKTIHTGDIISNTDYENYIVNEQKYYTLVSITKDTEKLYIAKKSFVNAGVPYGKGQVVTSTDYDALSADNKLNVKKVTVPTDIRTEAQNSSTAIDRYYCFEDYSYNNGTLSGEEEEFLTEDYFKNNKKNDQRLFTIQGKEPTETTTLYVSRESNAKDVTTEKVITVIYQYTYYEDADEGDGVSLTNELHVVNIHLQLESGIPEIGPLNNPPTVLPGTTVGLKAPSVNPGLYEVLTNGWEIFDSYEDAINHRNGVPFANNQTPVYWYQDQKAHVAFYSKTYLGKTYSNPVPLSVANYHDLDAVMKDKEHHLYVDMPTVQRESKIYIDNRTCESDASKSELDLLKDFFDLSLLDKNAVNTDGNNLITTIKDGSETPADSPFKGHALLDNHVRAGRNLEFFLNSDVSPKAYTAWEPIGKDNKTDDPTTTDVIENPDGQCFDGTLHGDGHTISGLSNSLFAHLCGEVYNLGVTGSFTTAGIADEGYGYVENCWVKTSATPAEGIRAVFHNPLDTKGYQLVNSYYPESNAFSTTSSARGNATMMPDKAFYNGTVAYNLNDFYLNKRYYNKKQAASGSKSYLYLEYDPVVADGVTLKKNPTNGYYPATPEAKYGDVGYVERRYADGDFRYAAGTIPGTLEKRQRTIDVIDAENNTVPTTVWAPVWPDDYLFFGQTLNFGYVDGQTHQNEPSAINAVNRVYRAPAYYRSSKMGVAHYNKNAVFAATKKGDATVEAFKNMTAIDFSGENDYADANYKQGFVSATDTKEAAFYPPLLDDEGITGFNNVNLTRNLLVYTTASRATTNKTVDDYMKVHDEEMVETNKNTYRTVKLADDLVSEHVKGHWVQDKIATRDHLLVDKQDFNCPIGYQFAEGKRMWYQRTPDRFVDLNKGWDVISLPFTTELVSTQDKGEITHFYKNSTTGHEYWLREYTGRTKQSENPDVYVANFNYPNEGGESDVKTYTNTFLWDFYYKKDSYQDLNKDKYQEKYYSKSHDMNKYPYSTKGTPYIVGFPGKTYYEFDLSGEWTPSNRVGGVTIEHPGKQTITFASMPGETIGVSDLEIKNNSVKKDGYTFMPNYMSTTVTDGYLMNADGKEFTQTTTATEAVPFRPYFVTTTAGSRTRSIVFNNLSSQLGGDDDEEPQDNVAEGITIRGGKHKVTVKSKLRKTVDVRIFSVSGLCVANFDVEPGKTVEQPITHQGTYIVHVAGGRFMKKLLVK